MTATLQLFSMLPKLPPRQCLGSTIYITKQKRPLNQIKCKLLIVCFFFCRICVLLTPS
uniref:Uncharacterized protein n=1 Tax=Rhizophora mucronata TaxID=61149 RepID=A0A2P2R2P7_RHIMU